MWLNILYYPLCFISCLNSWFLIYSFLFHLVYLPLLKNWCKQNNIKIDSKIQNKNLVENQSPIVDQNIVQNQNNDAEVRNTTSFRMNLILYCGYFRIDRNIILLLCKCNCKEIQKVGNSTPMRPYQRKITSLKITFASKGAYRNETKFVWKLHGIHV